MNRSPLGQLVLSRMREFYREPEALFWVYGFPVLMVVALGIAFRNKPVEQMAVDVEEGPEAARIAAALEAQPRFKVRRGSRDECRARLRAARTDVVVAGTEYHFDPTRPEALLARNAVDDALQRAAGRIDPVVVVDREFTEPGGRYVDFLVPGLLGMSLMGGGLWGVGWVTVEMRIRKLLKRLLATPMRKSDFLAGIMISRLSFLVPEVLVLLLFARYAFDVPIRGNLLLLSGLILLGSLTFSGLGLLVASRARTLEAVSGLMNLTMMPMWILSGVFFSADRFPEALQPAIKLLPLTPLNDALRAVMLDGAPAAAIAGELGLLAAWGGIAFVLALKWFRWS